MYKLFYTYYTCICTGQYCNSNIIIITIDLCRISTYVLYLWIFNNHSMYRAGDLMIQTFQPLFFPQYCFTKINNTLWVIASPLLPVKTESTVWNIVKDI